nr:MAG TPA: hypothetical protein [Caudoviricetes sp.]
MSDKCDEPARVTSLLPGALVTASHRKGGILLVSINKRHGNSTNEPAMSRPDNWRPCKHGSGNKVEDM